MALALRKTAPADEIISQNPPLALAPPSRDDRIVALDLARGVAITLMILSHGVKGLLRFDQIPPWGLVPVHLITKFSSTLFILVFGMALAVTQLKYVDTPAWPRKRLKLLLRGVVVLFWYKVLTIVELLPMYSKGEVLDTLLWGSFPVYAEILGFYGLALLWIPWLLGPWKRAPLPVKLAAPFVLYAGALLASQRWDFLGSESLRAILVESKEHYTWGQLTRGPLVFLGLLLGSAVLAWRHRGAWKLALGFLTGSVGLFAAFYLKAYTNLDEELLLIAKNTGKHPPETLFMLFSGGGALLVLALAFAGGRVLASALRPITIVGQDALQAFIFHMFVIFIFYRYLLSYWQSIDYTMALELTVLLIGLTALWVKAAHWIRERS